MRVNPNDKSKIKPKTARGLALALKMGREIDGRTSQAREIGQIKQAVRDDLNEAAQALLENDVAVCAIIQKMALKQAFSDPDKLVNSQGKTCYYLFI